jgi:hypothetical protein
MGDQIIESGAPYERTDDEVREARRLERGPAAVTARPTLATAYVHAVHPEHGEDVVYVPGQALPGWVAEALDAGRYTRDRDEVTLTPEKPLPITLAPEEPSKKAPARPRRSAS